MQGDTSVPRKGAGVDVQRPRVATASGNERRVLDDLLEIYEQRGVDAERVGATAPVAAVYKVVVRELRERLGACSTLTAAKASENDDLLTPQELATDMKTSVRYVYKHAEEWPFTRRLGKRMLRFSERAYLRWITEWRR